MCDGCLGLINACKHRIDLLDDEVGPVHSTPYWIAPTAKQFAVAERNGMLAENIIELSTTEWAPAVVLASKKDGLLRFCVVQLELDAVTVRDSYPFLYMTECIISLGETTVVSRLDDSSEYWQTALDEGDLDKTAFASIMTSTSLLGCHSG